MPEAPRETPKSHPHPRQHHRSQRARAVSRPRPRRAEGRDRLRRQRGLHRDLRLRPRPRARVRRDHVRNARHRVDLLGARLSRRSRAQGRHGDAVRPGPQPRGLSRRGPRLLSRSRRRRRRHFGAGARCKGGATARHRRAIHRRAANAATGCRARPRLCRAGQVDAAPYAGDRGHEGWPRCCRALCRRHWRRYASARILRHQIGDLGARRHPRAQGRAEAARACADCSMARRRRSKARHHARSSDPSHRGTGARQFVAGVAGLRAGAGQSDEVHGA